MKRKIFSQIFAIALLLQMVACQTPEAEMLEGSEQQLTIGSQWLAYNETQCADPWGYCNKDPRKITCVKEHLENMQVTVLEATVTGVSGEGAVCLACQCPSGRTFKVKVNLQDVSKLESIGFKKI